MADDGKALVVEGLIKIIVEGGPGVDEARKKLEEIRKEAYSAGDASSAFSKEIGAALGAGNVRTDAKTLESLLGDIAQVAERVGINVKEDLPSIAALGKHFEDTGQATQSEFLPALKGLIAATGGDLPTAMGLASAAVGLSQTGVASLSDSSAGLAALYEGQVSEAALHFGIVTKKASGEAKSQEEIITELRTKVKGLAKDQKEGAKETEDGAKKTSLFQKVLGELGQHLGGGLGLVAGIAAGATVGLTKLVELAVSGLAKIKEFFTEGFEKAVSSERQLGVLADRLERFGFGAENLSKIRYELIKIQDAGGAMASELLPVFSRFLGVTNDINAAMAATRLSSDLVEAGFENAGAAGQVLSNVLQGRARSAAIALGLSIRDLNGNIKSNEQLTREVLNVYSGLRDRLDDTMQQQSLASNAWSDFKKAVGEAWNGLIGITRFGSITAAALSILSGVVRKATADIAFLGKTSAAAFDFLTHPWDFSRFETMKDVTKKGLLDLEETQKKIDSRVKSAFGIKAKEIESEATRTAKEGAAERLRTQLASLAELRKAELDTPGITQAAKLEAEKRFTAAREILMSAHQENLKTIEQKGQEDSERLRTATLVHEARAREKIDLQTLRELHEKEVEEHRRTAKSTSELDQTYEEQVKLRRTRTLKEESDAKSSNEALLDAAALASAKEREKAMVQIETEINGARIQLLGAGSEERLNLELANLRNQERLELNEAESRGIAKSDIDRKYVALRKTIYEQFIIDVTELERKEQTNLIRVQGALAIEGSKARLAADKEAINARYASEIEAAERSHRDTTVLKRTQAAEILGLEESFARDKVKREEDTEVAVLHAQEALAGEASGKRLSLQKHILDIEHGQAVRDAQRRNESTLKIDEKYNLEKEKLDRDFSRHRRDQAEDAAQKVVEAELAFASAGSARQLDLTQRLLDMQHDQAVRAAIERGEDVTAIELALAIERHSKLLDLSKQQLNREYIFTKDLHSSQFELEKSRLELKVENERISAKQVAQITEELVRKEFALKIDLEEADLAERVAEINNAKEAAKAQIEEIKHVAIFRVLASGKSQKEMDEEILKLRQEALDTELDIENDASVQKLKARQISKIKIETLENQLALAIKKIRQSEKDATIQNALSAAQAVVSTLQDTFGKSKGLAIAQAIISTLLAVVQALHEPGLPWPARIALAAFMGATGFANVRKIASTSVGGGGESASVGSPGVGAGAVGPPVASSISPGARGQGGGSTAGLGFDDPLHDLLARKWGTRQAEDIVKHVGLGYIDKMMEMARGPSPVFVQDVSTTAGRVFAAGGANASQQTTTQARNFYITIKGMYGGRQGLRQLKRELVKATTQDGAQGIT